ncbi:MAG: methylated-DNA--[protein]-cysteine S-methyltransferase [Flavisolibacter sp.]
MRFFYCILFAIREQELGCSLLDCLLFLHKQNYFMTDINYSRIAQAIKYLSANIKEQPSLNEVAEHVHISPFHFQRIFTQWAGISPKRFLQYLTIEELKKELHNTNNLIEAAENVGLSAQSRVYDLFVTIEAVTPQEYKTKGKDILIEYGFHKTPFGECFIATTQRGICSLNFIDDNREEVLNEFKLIWEKARIIKNPASTNDLINKLFLEQKNNYEFKLLVKGTGFQVKVWEALLRIPFGSVASYQHIANAIDSPKALRAVGTAIGHNPVAYLIPCHRVIRSQGMIGDYHWGSERKAAIIGWEKARAENGKDSLIKNKSIMHNSIGMI